MSNKFTTIPRLGQSQVMSDSEARARLASLKGVERTKEGHIIVGEWIVEDGDTLINRRTGEHIRTRGIDTREDEHFYADTGRQINKERLSDVHTLDMVNLLLQQGGNIRIKRHEKDTHGRTVGTIFSADGKTDLNRAMVTGELGTSGTTQTMNFNGDDPYAVEDIRRSLDVEHTRRLHNMTRELSDEQHANFVDGIAPRERYHSPRLGATFNASIARGTDNLQATLYKGLEMLGETTGSETLTEIGREGFERNIAEAAENPARVARYDQINRGRGVLDTAGRALLYGVETVGEQLPQLGVDGLMALTGAGAGAVVARRVGTQAAIRGAMAVGPQTAATIATASATGAAAASKAIKAGAWSGYAASGFAQHSGENFRAIQEGTDLEGREAVVAALPAAFINTAMDVYGAQKLVDLLVKPNPADYKIDTLAKMFKEVGKRSGQGLFIEGATEFAQSIVTESNVLMHNPDHEIDIHNLIDAGIRGAIVGGTLGGLGGITENVGSVGRQIAETNRARTNQSQNDVSSGDAPPAETPPADTPPESSSDTTDKSTVGQSRREQDNRQYVNEPTVDIQAQARNLADPQHKREVMFVNEDQVDIVLAEFPEGQQPIVVRNTEVGDVTITTDPELAREYNTNAERAEVMGWANLDELTDDDPVLQAVNPETQAVEERLVSKIDRLERDIKELKEGNPNAEIVQTTVSADMQRREALNRAEAQQRANDDTEAKQKEAKAQQETDREAAKATVKTDEVKSYDYGVNRADAIRQLKPKLIEVEGSKQRKNIEARLDKATDAELREIAKKHGVELKNRRRITREDAIKAEEKIDSFIGKLKTDEFKGSDHSLLTDALGVKRVERQKGESHTSYNNRLRGQLLAQRNKISDKINRAVTALESKDQAVVEKAEAELDNIFTQLEASYTGVRPVTATQRPTEVKGSKAAVESAIAERQANRDGRKEAPKHEVKAKRDVESTDDQKRSAERADTVVDRLRDWHKRYPTLSALREVISKGLPEYKGKKKDRNDKLRSEMLTTILTARNNVMAAVNSLSQGNAEILAAYQNDLRTLRAERPKGDADAAKVDRFIKDQHNAISSIMRLIGDKPVDTDAAEVAAKAERAIRLGGAVAQRAVAKQLDGVNKRDEAIEILDNIDRNKLVDEVRRLDKTISIKAARDAVGRSLTVMRQTIARVGDDPNLSYGETVVSPAILGEDKANKKVSTMTDAQIMAFVDDPKISTKTVTDFLYGNPLYRGRFSPHAREQINSPTLSAVRSLWFAVKNASINLTSSIQKHFGIHSGGLRGEDTITIDSKGVVQRINNVERYGKRAFADKTMVAVDFETYYDEEVSLSSMSFEEYLDHPDVMNDDHFVLTIARTDANGNRKESIYKGKDQIRAAIDLLRTEKDLVLGMHNAAFDGLLLKKVFGWEPQIIDTLVLSRVLRPGSFQQGDHKLSTLSNLLFSQDKSKVKADSKGLEDTRGKKELSDKEIEARDAYALQDAVTQFEVTEDLLHFVNDKQAAILVQSTRATITPTPENITALSGNKDFKFTTTSKTDGDFAQRVVEAGARANSAKGKNLLPMVVRFVDKNGEMKSWATMVDAVVLATYGKGTPPKTLAEAEQRLYQNISALVMGGDNFNDGETTTSFRYDPPILRDDLVIWSDPDTGQSYTLGQARDYRSQMQARQYRSDQAKKRKGQEEEGFGNIAYGLAADLRDIKRIFKKTTVDSLEKHPIMQAIKESEPEVFEAVLTQFVELKVEDSDLDYRVPEHLKKRVDKVTSEIAITFDAELDVIESRIRTLKGEIDTIKGAIKKSGLRKKTNDKNSASILKKLDAEIAKLESMLEPEVERSEKKTKALEKKRKEQRAKLDAAREAYAEATDKVAARKAFEEALNEYRDAAVINVSLKELIDEYLSILGEFKGLESETIKSSKAEYTRLMSDNIDNEAELSYLLSEATGFQMEGDNRADVVNGTLPYKLSGELSDANARMLDSAGVDADGNSQAGDVRTTDSVLDAESELQDINAAREEMEAIDYLANRKSPFSAEEKALFDNLRDELIEKLKKEGYSTLVNENGYRYKLDEVPVTSEQGGKQPPSQSTEVMLMRQSNIREQNAGPHQPEFTEGFVGPLLDGHYKWMNSLTNKPLESWSESDNLTKEKAAIHNSLDANPPKANSIFNGLRWANFGFADNTLRSGFINSVFSLLNISDTSKRNIAFVDFDNIGNFAAKVKEEYGIDVYNSIRAHLNNAAKRGQYAYINAGHFAVITGPSIRGKSQSKTQQAAGLIKLAHEIGHYAFDLSYYDLYNADGTRTTLGDEMYADYQDALRSRYPEAETLRGLSKKYPFTEWYADQFATYVTAIPDTLIKSKQQDAEIAQAALNRQRKAQELPKAEREKLRAEEAKLREKLERKQAALKIARNQRNGDRIYALEMEVNSLSNELLRFDAYVVGKGNESVFHTKSVENVAKTTGNVVQLNIKQRATINAATNTSGKIGSQMMKHFNRLRDNLLSIFNEMRNKLGMPKMAPTFQSYMNGIITGQKYSGDRYSTLRTPDKISIQYFEESSLVRALRLAKEFLTSGKLPLGRFAWQSTIGDIQMYNEKLASMLFKRPGDKSDGKSYEALAMHYGQVYSAIVSKALDDIAGGTLYEKVAGAKPTLENMKLTNAREQMINKAFEDFKEGRDTKNGKIIGELIARLDREGKKHMPLYNREGKVPFAFNHVTLEADRTKLVDALLQTPEFKDHNPNHLNDLIDHMLDGMGNSEYAIGPGKPVGMHDFTSQVVKALGEKKLHEMNMLVDKPLPILIHFIRGLSQRSAWEQVFGDWVTTDDASVAVADRDPKNPPTKQEWHPNAKYLAEEAKILREHGAAAQAKVRTGVRGALGHRVREMNPTARRIQEELINITSWAILPFAGIASIPELGVPVVRGVEQLGLKGMFNAMGDVKWAKQYAQDIGLLLPIMFDQMSRSVDQGYEARATRKLTGYFFIANLQQTMSRTSRLLSVAMSQQFFVRAMQNGDAQALANFGLTADDVQTWMDGGRQGYMEGDSKIATSSNKVAAAVSQFVNEATLDPSRFQVPQWMNNPYMATVAYLKRFMWAFGDVVIGGMYRSGKHRYSQAKQAGVSGLGAFSYAAYPYIGAGMFLLALGAMSMETRDWIKGRDTTSSMSALQYTNAAFTRMGGYGVLEVVLNMKRALDYNQSILGSVAAPVGVIERTFDLGSDGELSQEELWKKIKFLLPFL